MNNFDEMFQAAKSADSYICLLCGVQYNVKGKVDSFTVDRISLRLDDSTIIMLDRTKLLGAFIAPAQPNAANAT